MAHDDTQLEEELFDQALALDDRRQRDALLDKACTGKPALRARLEALLAASTRAEGFFDEGRKALQTLLPRLAAEPSAGRPDTALPGGELLGKNIGRYRLLELIGEGGCGVVYLAEQKDPVQRRVALKIIKVGMETSTIVARFEAERQTLAMMDHPNIARVFDAGETDRGFPFFVMELVQGEEITKYCDRNRLDITERLQLFIQVCHALQHAHQKGIIHRDIKPANIMVTMVDDIPVPKIIDFGIAKATEVRLSENAMGTAYVQLIGTPAYMSPEQAQLRWMDVDTRSDIYSLGVLLYELLTGLTPFDPEALTRGGLIEMRSILAEQEPPRPSRRFHALPLEQRTEKALARRCTPQELERELQADLDWIAMKALEKKRRLRYETANGLAMDILRHLGSEAVVAHPPTWLYRTQKTIRRNRLLFAAGAAVTLALIAGMGTSLWLLAKEREARHRAVEAERQQASLRAEAEVREKITKATLLINQERYAEADTLLRGMNITQPSVEGAAAVRAVGEWHAIEGRYDLAVEMFRLVLRLDSIDGWDVSSLDLLRLGPALLLAERRAEYEHFRDEVLNEFVANPRAASDRVIKLYVLTAPKPAAGEKLTLLSALCSHQIRDAEAKGDTFQAAWACMAMALLEYRRGNHEEAALWSRRTLAYGDFNAPRSAAAHAVLALGLHHRHSGAEALEQLQRANEVIAVKSRTPLGRGSPVQGFWFDWVIAKRFVQEASEQLKANANR